MDILILLAVGGIIGWIASLLMRTDDEQGLLLNVVVGIVGAAVGGLLVTPLLGAQPITTGAVTLSSVVVSLLGAVILLAAINLMRAGSVR